MTTARTDEVGESDWIAHLPKAELHLHLEGSIRPATLAEIAPHVGAGEIESRYAFADFQGFLASYAWVTSQLTAPEHFGLVARRLLAELAAQNVTYVELNLSVGVMLWRNQDVEANFSAVEQAAARSPVAVRYIFDAVRQFGVDAAEHVAGCAIARKARGVVAYGLGGDEARGPARAFRKVFEAVRKAGLCLAPHGGETTGPRSVWEALEGGAQRIGHGIRSVEDPLLVRHLADHRIPLEISITSNLATGAVARLEDHPLRRIHDAGIPVILNTDDPAMFHTTLVQEYRLAQDRFDFSEDELRELAEAGFDYRFSR